MTRRTDPTRATVVAVRERDLWRCAMCGAGDVFRPMTTHHRIGRGMGGSRDATLNEPANLLTLCGSGTTGCHGWVTANPRQAYELGLAVKRGRNPAEVPVSTWRGWVFLNPDATVRLLDETGLETTRC